MPGKVGGGFYAVVRYDFEAERTDELAAKAGESIIVIAQSNYEWFVAKPIERLGGPGLIPVAFVEIRDLTTQQPIEDVNELISSGVIPKVEDWKKMTAEYKSTAIPLGRFDFPQSQPVADSPYQQSGSMQGSQDFGGEGEPPAPPPKRTSRRTRPTPSRSASGSRRRSWTPSNPRPSTMVNLLVHRRTAAMLSPGRARTTRSSVPIHFLHGGSKEPPPLRRPSPEEHPTQEERQLSWEQDSFEEPDASASGQEIRVQCWSPDDRGPFNFGVR